jgi:hypothetical protein
MFVTISIVMTTTRLMEKEVNQDAARPQTSETQDDTQTSASMSATSLYRSKNSSVDEKIEIDFAMGV